MKLGLTGDPSGDVQSAVRRVYIPKMDGRKRPIGVPTAMERGLQKAMMKRFMHADLKTQTRNINWFLRGHFNYYGMPGNAKKLTVIHYLVVRFWRRTLSRRSQKGKMSWGKMNGILKDYPLCRPRLKITYWDLAAYVRL